MIPGRMPSSAGRHTLRRNLRKAQFHEGGESRTTEQQGEREHRPTVRFDDFRENGNHGHGNGEDDDDNDAEGKRASFAGIKKKSFNVDGDEDDDDEKKDPVPSSSARNNRTSSFFTALSDPDSELARFLLTDDFGDVDSDDDEDEHLSSLFSKSVKNMATRFITGEDNKKKKARRARSMGSVRAWFYSLALEPMSERKERIIMLAEAYAIFGALFLSGTWVLYEWGSSKGYGGCNYEGGIGCHPYADRAFELVMAMTITANLFMAMFASFLWLMSICFSGSIRSWVFSARKMLAFIITLLLCVLILTVLGVALGLYSKLAPFWIEFVIAFSFFLAIVVWGVYTTSCLAAEEIGLEYYHFPLWFKSFIPFPMLKPGYRKGIREAAEKRAKELKTRAYQERTMLDPNAMASSSSQWKRKSSVGTLLRRAADAIGRCDFDVSKYEGYLEEDWYNDADDLKDMGVEVLSKYMPRRLAQEVHNILKLEQEKVVRTSSIGSGHFGDEHEGGRDQKISWNLNEESD